MKNIKFALYMILTSILLNGCVSMNASSSYVDKMTPEEASVISQSITKFVAKELPVASTTLALMPPTGKGSAILTPILTYDLRHRGFAVAQNGEPQKNIHSLQYIVTTFNNGILLRLQFDNIEASRWYSKDALGVISSDNEPFAVRK